MRRFGIAHLADRTSSVQAVDDGVAPALLPHRIVPLGSDVVRAFTEWLELVNGCS